MKKIHPRHIKKFFKGQVIGIPYKQAECLLWGIDISGYTSQGIYVEDSVIYNLMPFGYHMAISYGHRPFGKMSTAIDDLTYRYETIIYEAGFKDYTSDEYKAKVMRYIRDRYFRELYKLAVATKKCKLMSKEIKRDSKALIAYMRECHD